MNNSLTQESKLRAISGPVSQQNWTEISPGLNVKALVIDEARHFVEFLMKVDKDWMPGLHRHVCETSLLVIEGKISNRGTGNEYGPGDFFHQESGNTHIEQMGENGLVAYVSMRATSDTLVEFLDDNGKIRGTMGVTHFSQLLP